MPDVLLGQAYYLQFDPKLWQAQQPTRRWARSTRRRICARRVIRSRCSMRCWRPASTSGHRRLDRSASRRGHLRDSFNYLTKMCLLRMRQAAHTMIDRGRRRGDRHRLGIGCDRSSGALSARRRGCGDPRRGRSDAHRPRRLAESRNQSRRRPGPCVSGRCGHGAAIGPARIVRSTIRRSPPGTSSTSSATAACGAAATATMR